MNLEVAGVAERLVHEFPELPATTVIEAVCECADDCESAGPFFIEQAVRARLCAMRPGATQVGTGPVVIPAQPVVVEGHPAVPTGLDLEADGLSA
jgi:hypothetical protein